MSDRLWPITASGSLEYESLHGLSAKFERYLLVRARVAYKYERGEIAITAFGAGERNHQEFPRGDEIPWQGAISLTYEF